MAQEQEPGKQDIPGEPEDAAASTVGTEDTTMPAGEAQQAGSESASAGQGYVLSETEALLQEIENLQQKLTDSADNMLRLQAEMDNLRKRTSRDIENAHKYALDRFIKELLPVLDSMELGINASSSAEDIESLREGMDLTLKMFTDTLGRIGVNVIDPQGEKFDPEKHEAVTMQEGADAEANTVLGVMQKGYELNGRLVRPAMVIVAR